MSSYEWGLSLGAIGLYLLDSIGWLYSNELIFRCYRGSWTFAESLPLVVRGVRPYLPNPLTPGIPLFKVRWSESDPREQQEDREELERFVRALRPVKFLVNVLLLLLLALPLVLTIYGTDVQLLVLMAAYYGVILVALGLIHARRRQLRLTDRAFVKVCFDALACGPFAVNLLRNVSLQRSLAGNPIVFAGQSFAPAELRRLAAALAARVGDELARAYGQTAREEELEAFRMKLLAMADPPNRPV